MTKIKASKRTTMIALKLARSLIASERDTLFDCFTVSPDRSYDQMHKKERAIIRRFDRVLEAIDRVLK